MLNPSAVVFPQPDSHLRARSPSPLTTRGRRKSLPRTVSALSLTPTTPSAATTTTSRSHVRTPLKEDYPDEKSQIALQPQPPRTPFSTDIEAQSDRRDATPSKPATTAPAEYAVPTRTKLLFLAGWFGLNLVLTIYNKALLQGFHFPWLLTTIHATCVSIGCYCLLLSGRFSLTTLKTPENVALIAFSFLFTINIAISNVSLAAVSVPFHQVMRSTCPVFTILIQRFYYSRSYSTRTYMSVVPIVAGVALATYGDYYFTLPGFLLTLLGVVLASVKTVVSNRLMTGSLALPALEILLRMSPLAATQALVYAHVTGELGQFLTLARTGQIPSSLLLALAGNGVLAFMLNVSSFTTNKMSGALTLTVAGNLKQCLTILLGVAVFQVEVGLMNGVGMAVSVAGGVWYSKVELDRRRR